MACGCGGNRGLAGSGRRTVVSPRNTVNSLSVNNTKPTNNQVSAQSTPNNEGMSSDQRSREKQRRQAILKILGRL